MKKLFVTNAFSPSMLGGDTTIKFRLLADEFEASLVLIDKLRQGFEIVSAVGHADTASLFRGLLKFPVEMNRVKIELTAKDYIICGQLDTGGQRLPEGCTSLPEGAKIKWWLITIGDQPLTDIEKLKEEDKYLKRYCPCGNLHEDKCPNYCDDWGCKAIV